MQKVTNFIDTMTRLSCIGAMIGIGYLFYPTATLMIVLALVAVLAILITVKRFGLIMLAFWVGTVSSVILVALTLKLFVG